MRKWLYELMIGHTPLTALIGKNSAANNALSIYQNENAGHKLPTPTEFETSRFMKPALIYSIGTRTNIHFSETERIDRQYFQIYIHDEPSDYQMIDQIAKVLRDLLDERCAPTEGIIRVRYLEVSSDMDDISYGTIMKYIRFHALIKEPITQGATP